MWHTRSLTSNQRAQTSVYLLCLIQSNKANRNFMLLFDLFTDVMFFDRCETEDSQGEREREKKDQLKGQFTQKWKPRFIWNLLRILYEEHTEITILVCPSHKTRAAW